MYFINHLNPDEWWEWDKEQMTAYNYHGGHHSVDTNDISNAECCEYNSWHELYLAKHFCPLEVDKWEREVWISPEGKYYEGEAHAVMAEGICEIIYGNGLDFDFAEDFLEEQGWIRAASSFMWEVRFDNWKGKRLTQRQYDALWDWCECHKKKFPKDIEIK